MRVGGGAIRALGQAGVPKHSTLTQRKTDAPEEGATKNTRVALCTHAKRIILTPAQKQKRQQ